MWKNFILFCLLMLFIGSEVFAQDAQPEKKISVGVILPLSGSAASFGEGIRQAIELAYARLPLEKRDRINLVIEDDGFITARSVSAFQKLVSRDNIEIVFVVGSGAGHGVAPIAQSKGIPMIAIGASDSKIVKGRDYAFLHWVAPEFEAKVLVDEIVRRDYKRLSLVTSEQEGQIAIYDAIIKELEEHGIKDRVVLDERYITDEVDFRTYVTKARSNKVDGAIVILLPGTVSLFAKQMRNGGVLSDLIGLEIFEDENEVKASQGALIGQWYVNSDAATDEFVNSYKARYVRSPGLGGANGYDVLNLVADAVYKFGHNMDGVKKYLATIKDYHGATGVYSATGDNRFTLPAAVKIVTKDGFEKLH